MEQNIQTLIFHFSNGEVLSLDIGNYLIQFEVAGLFIKEKVLNLSPIATPEDKYRTVTFFQMANINYIQFKYYPNDGHMAAMN